MTLASALLLAVLAAVSFGASAAPAPQGTGSPARATCVLTNPGYAGKCSVTEDIPKGGTAKSACESVLTCLNDSTCSRTYCQATTVRGGWQLESATPQK